jgi:hypothetical protein
MLPRMETFRSGRCVVVAASPQTGANDPLLPSRCTVHCDAAFDWAASGVNPHVVASINERRGSHTMKAGPGGPDTFWVRKELRQILTSSSAVNFLPFVSGPRRTAMMTSSRKPIVLYIIGSAKPIF